MQRHHPTARTARTLAAAVAVSVVVTLSITGCARKSDPPAPNPTVTAGTNTTKPAGTVAPTSAPAEPAGTTAGPAAGASPTTTKVALDKQTADSLDKQLDQIDGQVTGAGDDVKKANDGLNTQE